MDSVMHHVHESPHKDRDAHVRTTKGVSERCWGGWGE